MDISQSWRTCKLLNFFNAILLYDEKGLFKEIVLNLASAPLSLSKITHQMLHNHPFSQRNKKSRGREWGG